MAADHPEVVARMRAHLSAWWDEVKSPVSEPQRVVIGSEAENPLMLTACEWLDVFVDQQRQIRRGEEKNGVWHLIIDRPGRYAIELRRWPKESGLALTEGIPATPVTDGRYVAGRPMAIASARLRIGNQEAVGVLQPDGQSFRCDVTLDAGPTELQTWFLNVAGEPICGAYYAYVRRLE